MTGTRNDIFDALLTIGTGIPAAHGLPAFGETGRKMGDPSTAQYPALWQIEGDEEYNSMDGQLTRRKVQVTWVVVQSTGADQRVVPARYTADLKDAIDATLVNGVHINTLGGRVFAAFIDGAVRRYAGDLDGIEMLVVPLMVILP
jgi:hypothetical protein